MHNTILVVLASETVMEHWNIGYHLIEGATSDACSMEAFKNIANHMDSFHNLWLLVHMQKKRPHEELLRISGAH